MKTQMQRLEEKLPSATDVQERVIESLDSGREVVERSVRRAKTYYTSTCVINSLMLFVNFFFLYFGTMFGRERVNVHNFFGFKEGRHEHLQRSSGMFNLILGLVNLMPLLKDEEHGKNSVMMFSIVVNAIVLLHQFTEAFYFVGCRMEYVLFHAFVIMINYYWTVVDYRNRRKVSALKGKDPEQVHDDSSVRKKIDEEKRKVTYA